MEIHDCEIWLISQVAPNTLSDPNIGEQIETYRLIVCFTSQYTVSDLLTGTQRFPDRSE